MDVPGIGPKTLEKLASAGIKTTQDLINAKTKSLATQTGLIREEDPDLEEPGQSLNLSAWTSPILSANPG